MLTDEQIDELLVPRDQTPIDICNEAYRLGVVAERKRCAEACQQIALDSSPDDFALDAVNLCIQLIERGEDA